MTDFDFGSVYGSARGSKPSVFTALLARFTDLRSRRSSAADRAAVRDAAPAGRSDRAYLADIGMEIGF